MRLCIGIEKLLRDVFGVECGLFEDFEVGSLNRLFLFVIDVGKMVFKYMVCVLIDFWLCF